jgi:hypothetical protein
MLTVVTLVVSTTVCCNASQVSKTYPSLLEQSDICAENCFRANNNQNYLTLESHWSKILLCFYNLIKNAVSRDSVLSIATGYGLDDRVVGDRVPVGVKNFFFFKSSRPALWSTQPPIQSIPVALSAGVKRPGREADHSPPTSVEVKKM